MNLPRGADDALVEALDRAGFGVGDVPDPASQAAEEAARNDSAAVELAAAYARLENAEGALDDEVRAARREAAEDGRRLADREVVDDGLVELSQGLLTPLDSTRDLLDERVARVAHDAVRVESNGHTVDLRSSRQETCPRCREDESETFAWSWFGFLGTTPGNRPDTTVVGWACLSCGSVVEETVESDREGESRVLSAEVVDAPEVAQRDVTDEWTEDDSEGGE